VDRRGRRSVEDRRDRQRGHRGRRELDRGHRDRIPPGQQPGLGDDESSGQDEGREDERVAGQGRRATAVHRDAGHPGQRHGEPSPRDRADRAAAEPDRQQGDQDRGTPDQQCGVADAGPGDARVLQHDHDAVAERAPTDDRRGYGCAQTGPFSGGPARPTAGRAPGDKQQERRGEREPGDRQPTGSQPGEGELGQRHGGAPEQARRGQCGKGEVTVTHATNGPHRRPNI
jgi:hypothetical protein